MRPTLLHFRSPKEHTPDFYSAKVFLNFSILLGYKQWLTTLRLLSGEFRQKAELAVKPEAAQGKTESNATKQFLIEPRVQINF